ncbi:SDR family NAD(P)-dependent oxidoreductase [Rhodobacteraceae bacterium 2CG4]|uniref:SDR family NAD(P)-dependent oxidoreductase n=1 Tax=Halovulum marinum TaxID=2662447 RepID=A0A6L5YZK0_9RHOB|nr:SDR family NAD(P)-dependent oxidoreductase [Halovulum marinum]MSU89677.1 SDR family NAD(P)-dependent oxidoreductase [Halovulum marinum]
MGLDALAAGNVAVVTGGAGGIGLAAAQRFAAHGMALAIADLREDLFDAAAAALRARGAAEVLARPVDVADRAAVEAFRDEILNRYGRIDVLMCNAGIQPGSDIFDTSRSWQRILDVNLGGVVNCCQAMVPGMIAAGRPGMVIATGSKQGITTPPGDPAYNTSKAGVKVFTEALAHHLREVGAAVSAHLLIPGFVYTGLTRGDRTEKPAAAWTPEQTAEFLMRRLAAGDFYILCPDNDVPRALDEKRMAWAMGDIIENRPPLSRWHAAWSAAFEDFLKKV